MDNRVIVWFSCGAASTMAAKLALEKYGEDAVTLVYCDVLADEHPDNARFFSDVENWLDVSIKKLSNDKYKSVIEVFESRKYMSGILGAPCTVEMKKVPRFDFQQADDIHIFGYTKEEKKRAERFSNNNPELKLDWILIDQEVSKQDCLDAITEAGIEVPMMYKLGFRNNNCIGCVKAGSARYWNMVRMHFPTVFEQRAEQSRRIGARLTKYKGERIFLDELPPDYLVGDLEDISCGPECAPTTFTDEELEV